MTIVTASTTEHGDLTALLNNMNRESEAHLENFPARLDAALAQLDSSDGEVFFATDTYMEIFVPGGHIALTGSGFETGQFATINKFVYQTRDTRFDPPEFHLTATGAVVTDGEVTSGQFITIVASNSAGSLTYIGWPVRISNLDLR